MPTNKQTELYANLMDEAKVRIDCISIAAQGRLGYPVPIIREFCYLQLRLLCELIALSCLVAHGDASLQSMGRAHSADDIIERLGKLRPHFYPFACKQVMLPERRVEMRVIDPPPLPKEELLALYGKAHKFLHRGSLKKILSSETPIDMRIDVPEIIGWAQKIDDLLSVHTIAIDKDTLISCVLRNVDDNNKVQVAILSTKQRL